jgi:hypothetical protein
MRHLSDADVGIGKHRLGSLDVLVGEFRRSTPGAAGRHASPPRDLLGCAPGSGGRTPPTHPTCEKPAAPARSSCLGFGQAAKPDASDPKVFDSLYQLPHRARQPIQFPNDQRVAAAREFECVMQSRAICYSARHLLGENLCAPGFGLRAGHECSAARQQGHRLELTKDVHQCGGGSVLRASCFASGAQCSILRPCARMASSVSFFNRARC